MREMLWKYFLKLHLNQVEVNNIEFRKAAYAVRAAIKGRLSSLEICLRITNSTGIRASEGELWDHHV